MTTMPVRPYFGRASWHVGFRDLGDSEWESRPTTGLAAFREARRQCLKSVHEIAGPGYPIRVHKIELERVHLFGRSDDVIEMHVTTITDHLPVRIVDTYGELPAAAREGEGRAG